MTETRQEKYRRLWQEGFARGQREVLTPDEHGDFADYEGFETESIAYRRGYFAGRKAAQDQQRRETPGDATGPQGIER